MRRTFCGIVPRNIDGTEGASPARAAYVYCIALAGIVVLAAILRLPSLGSRPLWLDEAYSAWFSALSFHELWSSVPQYETHPPLYYSLLKAWRYVFGDSEAGLRSLSVVASVATVLLVAGSGRLLKLGRQGETVSLLAALLLAVNAGSIKYAQEARPYALETLAVTVAVMACIALLQTLRRKGAVGMKAMAPWAGVLALSGGLLLWCHNTALFVAFGIWFALGVAVLIEPAADRVRPLFVITASGVAALFIWAPFLPWFIHQSRAFSAMQFWIEPRAADLISAWILAGGGTAPAALAVMLGLAGSWALWRRDRSLAVFACIVLVLPLSLVLGISFAVKPIYIDRLFGWMAVPLALLAACGIVSAARSPGLRTAVIVVLLIASLRMVISQYIEAPIEDIRGLSAEVAAKALPGDIVVAVPNELAVGFEYYGREPNFPVVSYIPGPFPYLRPAGERRYVGNLGAPAVEASDASTLASTLAASNRVWLVTRRSDLYDPQGYIEDAVQSGRELVSERRSGLIDLRLFGR